MIREIVAKTLGLAAVRPMGNFFALGGDSIIAVQFAARAWHENATRRSWPHASHERRVEVRRRTGHETSEVRGAGEGWAESLGGHARSLQAARGRA
jgi:hypothetical protein